MPRGPSSTLPLTTRPPPHPVPRITPNTVRAFSAAPSMASDKAKQLASLASRTGPPSAVARSRSKGRSLSQVELAFCIRPVWGEMETGNGDADGGLGSDVLHEPAGEIDNGHDSSRVVVAWRRYTIARHLRRLGAQEDTLNLRPAKI